MEDKPLSDSAYTAGSSTESGGTSPSLDDVPKVLRRGRLRDEDYWLFLTQSVRTSDILLLLLIKAILWVRQSTKFQTITIASAVLFLVVWGYLYFNPIPKDFSVYGKAPDLGVFLRAPSSQDSNVRMVGVGRYTRQNYFTDLAVRLFYREGFRYLTSDKFTMIENFKWDHITDMDDLVYQSKLAAYIHVNELLGTPVEWSSKTIVKKSGYKEGNAPILLPNDEIISIDGRPVEEFTQTDFILMNYDNKLYDVEFKRGNEVFIKRIKFNSFEVYRYYFLEHLGVLEDFNNYFSHDDDYYQGNSGTLAIALQYYLDRTGHSLPFKVALTGSMNAEGLVEQVGGVAAKTITVHREGIKVFFVPTDKSPIRNYSRALEVKQGMGYDDLTVVEVRTFSDVLKYLGIIPPVNR